MDRCHFDAPENVYFAKISEKVFLVTPKITCKGDFQRIFDVTLEELG